MILVCPIAGAGTRLMPFTYSKPKAALKIAGKRLIDHILIKLKKTFPEKTTICFIVGYKKRQLTEYIQKHYSDYFKVEFIEQKPLGYTNDVPYFSGLGDAILLSRKLAEGEDCFIFLSDRLPLEEYSSILLNYHNNDCDGLINVQQVDEPKYYGVTVLDEEEKFITKIVEKPQKFISNYAVSGAYLFGKSMTPRLFELLEEQSNIKLENGKEHQLTPVIEKLIEEGYRIKINEMKEEILDFGRPEGLLHGNRHLLAEIKNADPLYESLVKAGNIVDSKIVPPVYLGKNVRIVNSVIGPNVSIGDEVQLEKCILKETVIGDGTKLRKLISNNSIIGDYSILEDLIKQNITIGDSSIITTTDMNSF
ncbi:MAG: NDP-sugar synthase [Promethearchaeota archaeon]|nr:MAG: NDP-sugar synthase [Candidatus Lokiarchaeota archaeon]